MLFQVSAAMLKDTLSIQSDYKYRVTNILKDNGNIQVICELLENGNEITLTLRDIIQEGKLKYFNAHDILLLSSNIGKDKSLTLLPINPSYNLKYYHFLGVCFIICLVTSNLAAMKMCNIFGYILDGGNTIFPILYILNDVLTEVYGFSASRKVLWTGLFSSLAVTLILYLVTYLPAAEDWQGQQAFTEVFSLSPKIFIASITSYLIGEFVNASIISMLKIKLKGRQFVLRALISTAVGSFLESIIFCFLAFFPQLTFYQVIEMATLLTVIKVIYEILVIPITIRLVAFLKIKEGRDIFEKPTLKALLPGFND